MNFPLFLPHCVRQATPSATNVEKPLFFCRNQGVFVDFGGRVAKSNAIEISSAKENRESQRLPSHRRGGEFLTAFGDTMHGVSTR